jgi:hypothetical protein
LMLSMPVIRSGAILGFVSDMKKLVLSDEEIQRAL